MAYKNNEENANSACGGADHFGNLFPKGQEWFSPKEAGYIIGRSDQFVRNCFYTGKIMGHISNGLAEKGEEKKTYMRVHKSALMIYLLESANYTPDYYMEKLETLLAERTDYQLLRLEKFIKELLYGGAKKTSRRPNA